MVVHQFKRFLEIEKESEKNKFAKVDIFLVNDESRPMANLKSDFWFCDYKQAKLSKNLLMSIISK